MGAQIRVAGIVEESIVDGPGLRYVVFAQGCRHHCPGCHNPQTHSFKGGSLVEVEEMVNQMEHNPLLDGITLSGGEPLEQAKGFVALARAAKEMALHIMIYTGYTYEEIVDLGDDLPGAGDLLDLADILVDGPFQRDAKDPMLRFRGSGNQRIIHLPSTRRTGRVVLAGM